MLCFSSTANRAFLVERQLCIASTISVSQRASAVYIYATAPGDAPSSNEKKRRKGVAASDDRERAGHNRDIAECEWYITKTSKPIYDKRR